VQWRSGSYLPAFLIVCKRVMVAGGTGSVSVKEPAREKDMPETMPCGASAVLTGRA